MGFGADFRVLGVGVHYNDIIGADWHGELICPQEAGAAGDEKYLGTGMGMQHGIPFGTVAGYTDIEKLCDGAVDGVDCQRIENVAACTHGRDTSWYGSVYF